MLSSNFKLFTFNFNKQFLKQNFSILKLNTKQFTIISSDPIRGEVIEKKDTKKKGSKAGYVTLKTINRENDQYSAKDGIAHTDVNEAHKYHDKNIDGVHQSHSTCKHVITNTRGPAKEAATTHNKPTKDKMPPNMMSESDHKAGGHLPKKNKIIMNDLEDEDEIYLGKRSNLNRLKKSHEVIEGHERHTNKHNINPNKDTNEQVHNHHRKDKKNIATNDYATMSKHRNDFHMNNEDTNVNSFNRNYSKKHFSTKNTISNKEDVKIKKENTNSNKHHSVFEENKFNLFKKSDKIKPDEAHVDKNINSINISDGTNMKDNTHLKHANKDYKKPMKDTPKNNLL